MYGFKEFLVLSVVFALCQGGGVELANARMGRIYGPLNRYYIYNENLRNPVTVSSTTVSTVTLPLRATEGTVIIAHEGGGSFQSTLNSWLKDAFLTNENLDIIILDWEHVAGFSDDTVQSAMDFVARDLFEVINTLIGLGVVSLDTLHLVGFDHGAHLVGMAGRLFLDEKVARITGLDPSGGNWATSSRRLAATDAEYVEVIHTDGSGTRANGIGVALGHADFFPNGGTSQPGCSNNLCNHNRAWELFSASLTNGGLIANRCVDMNEVSRNRCTGFTLELGTSRLDKQGSGLYRVNTGRVYPYLN